MGTIKIRLIDTDVILNLILMQKRSNIHLGLGSPNETFNIITTDIVCQEVQSGINRAKKTKEYKNSSINEDEKTFNANLDKLVNLASESTGIITNPADAGMDDIRNLFISSW